MKLYVIKHKYNAEDILHILVDEDKIFDFKWKLQKLNIEIYKDFMLWHLDTRDYNAEPEKSSYTLEIKEFDNLSIEEKLVALINVINSMYK